MNVFKMFGKDFSYKDDLQLDGAFSAAHINYGKSPMFNNIVGRHAIEIGFKYLLVKKTGHIDTIHDLEKLSNMLYSEYNINDDYMDYVQEFCKYFSQYIEGGNAEYFRFPEYKGNTYFAGNCLDIKWLSYNLALIILKLIHFSGMDNEI